MKRGRISKKVNREEENFIQDLKSRNSVLQKDNNAMQGKLKNASFTLKKYKQQIQSMKARLGSGPTVRSRKLNEQDGSGCKMSVAAHDDTHHQYDDDVNIVLSKLQQRLLEADNKMNVLRSENEELKVIKSKMERHFEHNSVDLEERADEVSVLKKELCDAIHNLKTMNVQYTSLEANAQIQLEIQKETRMKLEQCNSYILKLQKERHALHLEKDAATKTARKAEEHKEQVQDLLEENRLLEDNLSKLCELPFVQDEPIVSTDQILEEQISELEVKNAEYREQILENAKEKKKYEEMIALTRDENDRWKTQCEELQYEYDVLKVNNKDLEDKDTQTHSSPIQRHQSFDLHKEDKYTQTKELEVGKKDKSIQLFSEELFDEEMKKNVMSTEANITPKQQNPDTNAEQRDYWPRNIALSKNQTLNQNTNFDLDPNTLEISIDDIELEEIFFSMHDKTMVVFHFLNFEAKASNQCIGRQPIYDFLVKYDLSMSNNEDTQREIESAQVFIELYRIISPQDFEHVGFASLTLNEVKEQMSMSCKPEVVYRTSLEFVSKNSDSIVGSLNLSVYFDNTQIQKRNTTNDDKNAMHTRTNIQEKEEGKEEKYNDSISDEDDTEEELFHTDNHLIYTENKKKGKNNAISAVLQYFEKGGNINYIDFLRFVDPPYPILNQIEHLRDMISPRQLEHILNHNRPSSRATMHNKDDLNVIVSEEDFVQTVAMLGTNNSCSISTNSSNNSNDEFQLDEIHEVYRHIDTNRDKKVTLKRILYFLYSPDIKEVRTMFLKYRKSSINPWGPFKVADYDRTGFVSKGAFSECLRSIGIEGFVFFW